MSVSRRTYLLIAASALLMLAGCGTGANIEFSTGPINIMVPASPGGGWDQTGRALQTAFSNSTGKRARVYNVPGAGGTVGLAQFASDHEGDPHQLLVGGLVMLGFIEANQSPVTLEQVTPIALLTAEWQAVVVSTERSPYHTFRELKNDFKDEAKRPAISWGGGSAGGTDHILAALIAKAADVEPREVNYIAHSGGGELRAAILSGAVSVGVTGLSEAMPLVNAKKLRLLAVSSPKPIKDVNAPTLRQEGVDVVLANWRAVFGPPGLSQAQQTAVIAALTKMRDSEEWKQALEKNRWDDFFKTGGEFAAFLKEEGARVAALKLQAPADGFSVTGPWFFPLLVVVVLGALVASFGVQSLARLKRQNSELRLAVQRTLSILKAHLSRQDPELSALESLPGELCQSLEKDQPTRFTLDEASLKVMRADGLPQDVQKRLGDLQPNEFTLEESFMTALARVLNEDELKRYRCVVLKHARIRLDWRRVGLTVLALVGYALMLAPLGYVLATALFFPAAARILGSCRPVRDLLLGIGLGVVVYVVFTVLLEVRLPGGIVGWLLGLVA